MASANGRSMLVLYRIVNSDSDQADPLFNCFRMPYNRQPTLATVKQHFVAAHSLSHIGPEGYHWRVLVEDKPLPGNDRTFSWWDVQDSNAKLPVKETSQYDLKKLLFPPSKALTTTDSATKAAKGAFKMMGKAVAAVAGEDTSGADHGPPVSVLTFKLLDLIKINDDFNLKHGIDSSAPRPATTAPRSHVSVPRSTGSNYVAPQQQRQPTRAPPPQQQQRPHTAQAPRQPSVQQQPHHPVRAAQPPPAQHRPAQQEASLMDFGDAPAASAQAQGRRVLHHTTSSPATFGKAAPNPNETRTQKLKREYAEKKSNSNRVWDPIDERWVEVKPGASAGSSSAPPGESNPGMPAKKETGISLTASSGFGKSASVQAAVNKRVKDMEDSQEKALREVREREAAKKKEEEEEDAARKLLEPKIKKWSEEHGKKKQLQALLASLHTVLWPGAKWKQISIGDVLNDSKVNKFYKKASLVVHPDKTGHLPADQRFLAKRIFDALTQAKTEFDEGKN